MGGRKIIVAAAGWLALLCGSQAPAAEPAGDWLTGRELAQKFAEPITVQWSAAPLKRAISDLARVHRVCLFLDRRIDPEQPVTLSVKNRPLAEVCGKLAAYAKIGFCRLDALGYFGPPGTCSALPTVVAIHDDEVARLPSAARLAWNRKSAWGWPDFSTPRELAQQLAQSAHAELEAPQKLPHDLWAAAQLPPLTVVERLTLVSASFDLSFELDDEGRRVRWTAWPERPVIERTYSVGARAGDQLTAWKALAPRSTLKLDGAKVIVLGPVEDQQRIAAAANHQSPSRLVLPPKRPGTQVYTLELAGVPLAALLEVLERKLDLHFELDQPAIAKAKIDMQRNVSLKVEQATLDELLEAALKPAGLTFARKGKTIKVRPAAK